jgi:hypothetical protein
MRILDFPGPAGPGPDELEAALHGELTGPAAEFWRELRADVRSLAEPLDPDFSARLGARLAAGATGPTPAPSTARARGDRRRGRGPLGDRRVLGGLAAAVAAVTIGAVVTAPFNSGGGGQALPGGSLRGSPAAAAPAIGKVTMHASPSGAVVASPRAQSAPALPSSAPGRVQELGASVTLGADATEIQKVADGVSRLVVSEGGFVRHSQVEQSSARGGEATLALSIPSAKLSHTLAALGRLAPVRAESQSLQDVTGSYEAAKRRLADTVAERAALLRALARASSQGQIESLRRRLSLAGGAIADARSSLRSLSHRASNSSVEVTILAGGHPGGEGLTLDRGLHDAGRVLTVALIVVLVGLAGLVPALAALALALAATRRGRRLLRERALP